jgi:hypothetical protein
MSFVGDILGMNAAEDAEDAQYAANRESQAFQRETRDQVRADNMPFLQTGYRANDQLSALLAGNGLNTPNFQQYQSDPSYRWQQNEGARMVQNSAAAGGGLYSGRTLKALQDRSQNLANADYGNWWNRQEQGKTNKVNLLNAIRSGGQAAAGAMGSASMNAGNVISSNLLARGENKADELIAQGAMQKNMLNRASSYMTGGFFGM